MIGIKGLILLGLLGVASSNSIQGYFVPGVGWQVNFFWTGNGVFGFKMENASITRNNKGIVDYIPTALNTPLVINLTYSDADIAVNCTNTGTVQGGVCLLLVEPKGQTGADTYTLRVFYGTAPWEIVTVVETVIDRANKPNIREMQAAGERQMLNCSSAGIPSPTLVWTTAATNGQEIEADSNGSFWDPDTKLWNSWSILKPLPDTNVPRVFCTPLQWQGDKLITGAQESHSVTSSGIMVKASFFAMATAFLYLLLQ